jgi:hypothetical protein
LLDQGDTGRYSGGAAQYGSNKKKGRKEDKEEVSMAY